MGLTLPHNDYMRCHYVYQWTFSPASLFIENGGIPKVSNVVLIDLTGVVNCSHYGDWEGEPMGKRVILGFKAKIGLITLKVRVL